jgi:cell division protein FtsX
MPELDDRLRAALGALRDAAEQEIRPPGSDTVPAAARRRRRTALAATAILVLVLAVAASEFVHQVTRARATSRPAAACTPVDATAYLPNTYTPGQLTVDDVRNRAQDVLRQSPAVLAYSYESNEQAYERFKEQFKDAPDLIAATRPETLPASYRFTLRCASDYPVIRPRLMNIPGNGVYVTCTCDRRTPDKPTVSGTR